ncbi:MAG: hypothetical protein GY716_08685 [bacterium]|nr:hypothetical protein [bacterium]
MSSSRVRIVFFSHWAEGLHDAGSYLEGLPARDLRSRVSDADSEQLLRMARLDCDWDGECLRAFSDLRHPDLEFAPARIADPAGLLQLMAHREFDEAQPWLVLIAQRPAPFAPVIGRLLEAFKARGGRVLYWAYDDASHTMDCFSSSIAPHLSVLIHDENPLDKRVRDHLPADCRTIHSSWTANVVPFAYPFCEQPEESIVFLGSQLGVTPHRLRQIEALQQHFKDRFRAVTDHSVPVAEREAFTRVKVHVCPEGRKFSGDTMHQAHTDRPFWAGCMGQVPVSEDSKRGGRLASLAEAGMIVRYAHGDLDGLIEACEHALALDVATRRRIYDYFNREGTVGPVVGREIARFLGVSPQAQEQPAPAAVDA